MGNCDHQQFQFSIENIENFNDFEEAIDKSIDFEETIIFFNGFEETIGNCHWFWRAPSPLNVFWYSGYCYWWFFNGFWVAQLLVSMAFNGQIPLVKRWNGFDGPLRSTLYHTEISIPNPIPCIPLTPPRCYIYLRCVLEKKRMKFAIHCCLVFVYL